MNYIIDDRGITFIVEDIAPPDLPPEPEPPPIPLDEAVEAMHEISAWIEALG